MSDYIIKNYKMLDFDNNLIDEKYNEYYKEVIDPSTFETIVVYKINYHDRIIKNCNWLKCREDNYIFNSSGIYKNRKEFFSEFFCPLTLDLNIQYTTDRIFYAVKKLDELNITFNLIQKKDIDNESGWNTLWTYVMFENKTDLAKYKMLT